MEMEGVRVKECMCVLRVRERERDTGRRLGIARGEKSCGGGV